MSRMFRLLKPKRAPRKQYAEKSKNKNMSYNYMVHQYNSMLREGNLHKVKHFLLNEGLAVDIVFEDGSWPLHITCEKGHYELTELLLSLKANPNIKNRHGQTPLILAINNIAIVRLLLNYSAKLNTSDSQKRTALHFAGAQGNVEVVTLLLEHGAKVNICDRWGRTALHTTLLNVARNQAAGPSYHEVVRVMAGRGSLVNKRDQHHYTPLFLSVNTGNTDIFSTVLACGALPDLTSRHDLTCIMLAVMKGHLEICRLLLQRNCNVNVINKHTRKTCFQESVYKGHLEISELLLLAGVTLHTQHWLYDRLHSTSALLTLPRGTTDNVELMAWLRGLTSSPLTLRNLCRSLLRRTLGAQLQSALQRCGYPAPLQQFVLMERELQAGASAV